MKPQHRITKSLTYIGAVLSLRIRRLRVVLVLSASFLPDLVRRKVQRLRSDFPVGRAAATFALAAAIVVPSLLYVQERGRRASLDASYRQLDLKATAEIGTLTLSLRRLADEQERLRSLLLESGHNVVSDGVLSTRVIATGYSSSIWETDDTPFITASNTRTRPGVVALSRDMLQRYNPQAPFHFGDTVHISGIGEFLVEDSMHWRWRKRIDIWFPSRDAAWNFGRREVTISMPLGAEALEKLATDGTVSVLEDGPRLASRSEITR